MAGLVDEVGAYLDSQLGSLTLGTNFFLGLMPDTPDVCTAVYEYASGGVMETYAQVGAAAAEPYAEQPRLQVSCRGTRDDYSTPRTQIRLIAATLNAVLQQTLSGVLYYRIVQADSPSPAMRDDDSRVLFTQNFLVTKAVS